MHSLRPSIFLALLSSAAIAMACGFGGDKASSAHQPAGEPTPQDTGKPGSAAKAQVQATIAVAQANADAQAAAQADAQAAAAATDACEPREPAPIGGPDCVTATITCGQTIQGTTVGGSRKFDGDRYVHSYCFPTTEDSHRGTERVYAFNLLTDQRATFELDSPCADLDLAVLRWEDTSRCPGSTVAISECEGQNRGGGGTAKIWNNRPSRYLVIVDGSDAIGANFELSVSCVEGEK